MAIVRTDSRVLSTARPLDRDLDLAALLRVKRTGRDGGGGGRRGGRLGGLDLLGLGLGGLGLLGLGRLGGLGLLLVLLLEGGLELGLEVVEGTERWDCWLETLHWKGGGLTDSRHLGCDSDEFPV